MSAEQYLSIENITGDLESVKKFIELLSSYNKKGYFGDDKQYISFDGLEYKPENLDELFDKWETKSKIDCDIIVYGSRFSTFGDLEFFETLSQKVPEINFEGSYELHGDYDNLYYNCTYKNHKFHAVSRFQDESTDQILYLNNIRGEKDVICNLCNHLENLDDDISIYVEEITYLQDNKEIENYEQAIKDWNDKSTLDCILNVDADVWEAEDFEDVGFFEFLVENFKDISFVGKFVYQGNAYIFNYIDGRSEISTEKVYCDEECYDKEF
jgi:hypothetical protein